MLARATMRTRYVAPRVGLSQAAGPSGASFSPLPAEQPQNATYFNALTLNPVNKTISTVPRRGGNRRLSDGGNPARRGALARPDSGYD